MYFQRKFPENLICEKTSTLYLVENWKQVGQAQWEEANEAGATTYHSSF